MRIRYALRLLDQDHTYFLAGVEPGTMWVLPENLSSVTAALESYGITAIEAGTHAHVGPTAAHTTFLDMHHNHDQRRQQLQREANTTTTTQQPVNRPAGLPVGIEEDEDDDDDDDAFLV